MVAHFVHLCQFVLELLSIFCIIFGLVKTIKLAIKIRLYHNVPQPFVEVRLSFGIWLSLALELQLGADILATIISPNFESLGELAALAVIRTFLNYFLNKELEEISQFKDSKKRANGQFENET